MTDHPLFPIGVRVRNIHHHEGASAVPWGTEGTVVESLPDLVVIDFGDPWCERGSRNGAGLEIVTMSDITPSRRWRHIKRGTIYEVIGWLDFRTSLIDESMTGVIVMRRIADGKIAAWSEREFRGGRFQEVTP